MSFLKFKRYPNLIVVKLLPKFFFIIIITTTNKVANNKDEKIGHFLTQFLGIFLRNFLQI